MWSDVPEELVLILLLNVILIFVVLRSEVDLIESKLITNGFGLFCTTPRVPDTQPAFVLYSQSSSWSIKEI